MAPVKLTDDEKRKFAEGLAPEAAANLIQGCLSVHFDRVEELIHIFVLGINETDNDNIGGVINPAYTFNATDLLASNLMFTAAQAAFAQGKVYDVPQGTYRGSAITFYHETNGHPTLNFSTATL